MQTDGRDRTIMLKIFSCIPPDRRLALNFVPRGGVQLVVLHCSPFGPIINLTRNDCEVATSMFDQIGHTQRFEDDRYQADMMVLRVTNLEVVA